MELAGKAVLVTGGAQRVGQAISLGLARAGAQVAIHYHNSREDAEKTLAQVKSENGSGCLVHGDLSSIADVRNVVDTCASTLGGLDVLVNNAALYLKTPPFETSEEDWDRLFGINLKAPYFCSVHAVRQMREQGQGGKIINVADVSAYSPWPDYVPYCTTKAGLIAMTKGLAKAFAPDILVNAVASGTVLMSDGASTDYTAHIAAETLLKRIGSPQDIVNAVLFLIEGGDYITGEILAVDGGRQIS